MNERSVGQITSFKFRLKIGIDFMSLPRKHPVCAGYFITTIYKTGGEIPTYKTVSA
jgi:hypothetical protein